MNAVALVRQIKNIFSLPEVVVSVNEILNSPEPDIARLEQTILHDPALTAKLLKIANSSYFGLILYVDSVSRAISLLGLHELRNMVMGVAVTQQFESIPDDLVDMNTFWYHSVVKGVLAKILAKQLEMPNAERFYITGLVSSLGKLVLFSQYPARMQQLLSGPEQSDAAMLAAETAAFGFDHAELGAELLREWNLPENIWRMVRYQFDPLHENALQTDACILYVAGKISNTIQPCHNRSYDVDQHLPEIDARIMAHVGLTPDIIQAAASEAILYPMEILKIIYPGGIFIF